MERITSEGKSSAKKYKEVWVLVQKQEKGAKKVNKIVTEENSQKRCRKDKEIFVQARYGNISLRKLRKWRVGTRKYCTRIKKEVSGEVRDK